MSKLPQTDELPHADEGFDPARVEEAFATFANRVRELESVASELRAELRSLRAERTAPGRSDDEDWPVEAGLAGRELPSPDWVATVPPPFARGVTVPRLAIEGAFLLLVALLAGLADLAAGWIVLVMVVAWVLVALAEWAAAAKRSRWRLDEVAPAVEVPSADASDSTGPWDTPVVESTAVAPSATASESKTIVTKLPTGPVERADTQAPEPEQKSRRGRRRKAAEQTAADPWEA